MKKIVKNAFAKQPDIERLKFISRNMLEKLEHAIELVTEKNMKESEQQLAIYDKIFGAKTSYVSVLIDLAKIIQQLENATQTKEYDPDSVGQDSANTRLITNMQDQALIEEFIRKRRANLCQDAAH